MFKNRVYIEREKDAPSDAIVREGKRGRLYYRTDERGRNQHVGGEKDNDLLDTDDLDKSEIPDEVFEDGDVESKSFEGPEGQGPWPDFQSCVESMEDEGEIDDPEAWCAWAHHEDTNQWPGEENTSKVYVDGPDDVPDGAILERDGTGLFYRQQAYEMASNEYPDTVEDDLEDRGVDLPDAEDADGEE